MLLHVFLAALASSRAQQEWALQAACVDVAAATVCH
jgi:hypothetical protein